MGPRTLLFAAVILLFHFKLGLAGCDYTCEPGYQKEPSGYQAKANGCGAGKGLDFNSVFPAFTEICNEHDLCYGKCGTSKMYCDREFSREMNNYCESARQTNSVEFYRQCKETASFYSLGVEAVGCPFYLAAQKEACVCNCSNCL